MMLTGRDRWAPAARRVRRPAKREFVDGAASAAAAKRIWVRRTVENMATVLGEGERLGSVGSRVGVAVGTESNLGGKEGGCQPFIPEQRCQL